MRQVILLLLLGLTLSGCSRTDSVRMSKPAHLPQRIVSLTPSNTEILFALGLGDKVVGVTKYCDYPPDAVKKPKVGESNVSLEKVIALKPDLVLVHSFLNNTETARLKSLGIKALGTDPKTFSEVTADIRRIGKATGASEKAEILADSMDKSIQSIKDRPHSGKKTKTLVVIQTSPLWVAGPETFVDEMITCANGENIANDAKAGFNLFSSETAFARNPDLIIVTRPEDKAYFENNSVWKKTNAVRNSRVELIDPDLILRPGPRLVKGLAKLSAFGR